MAQLDLHLVSGCRPDLLARTLESFSARLFAHVALGQVLVNLDPFGGDAAAGNRCEALIRARFPQARISRPETPGLGAAVKRLWSQAEQRPVLHLEDDWLLEEDLDPGLLDLLSDDVSALQLSMRPRSGPDEVYNTRLRRVRWHGLPLWRKRVSKFGTSPRFLSADFARGYAARLDPELDPEKQVYHGRNPDLADWLETHRCRLLFGADGGPLIRDLGRDWHREQGLRKISRAGQSYWVPREPGR